MNAGVFLSETPLGSVTGDLVAVPAAAPAAEETPAAPSLVVEETPAPPPDCKCMSNCCSATPTPEDNRYTVSLSMMGFEVTREFTVKIDVEARKIYLS
jgi:hypothetical protein